tara:strand:- start:1 stop:279 length:279 start_codon:yes stop_codon:yes gene_type:complete
MERKDNEEKKGDPTGDPVSMSAPAERQDNEASRQQLEAIERRRQAVRLPQHDIGQTFMQRRRERLEALRLARLRQIAQDDERKRQTRNPPIP